MSHSQSGWTRHHITSSDFIRVRSRAVALARNATQHDLTVATSGALQKGKVPSDDAAFWNDVSAKNLNLLIGGALLIAFLASVPRWIEFFSATRGRSTGWMLGGCARAPVTISTDEKLGYDKDEKKHGQVVVDLRGTRFASLAPITPTGTLTIRLRTFRSTYLLRSLPLPFGLLSHLSVARVFLCLLYQVLVIFTLFHQCSDHRTNWKRTGYIAVAQLPAVFLAVTKNGIGHLIGTSYDKINFLHRVAGRLVFLASLLHALLFLRIRNWTVNWQSEAQKTGMLGILALCLVFFSLLKFVRRAFYQVFLVCHLGGIVIFLIALRLHAPSVARPYTTACVVIYGVDLVVRICKTRQTLVSLAPLSSNMTMVQAHELTNGWRAGQHVLIREWSWRRWYENHPFTVALILDVICLESGSHKLTLLAKSTGGFTRSLYDRSLASSTPLCCTIEGPYGHPLSLDFASFQSVLLFAGGTGITFCASILEELVGKASRRESRNRDITLVWSMRNVDCIEWYRSLLTSLLRVAGAETGLTISIYLHVTGTATLQTASPIPCSHLSHARPNPTAYLSRAITNVVHSLSDPSAEATEGHAQALSVLPNGGGLAVGVCGPRQFGAGVREAVSRVEQDRASKVGGIVFHEESFGC
ncbi:hypothetical protein JCM11491_004634 [Sporobolomyces phaffii]